MASIWGEVIPGAAALSLTLRGVSWRARPLVSERQGWTWRGTLIGPDRLVSLAILRHGDRVTWAKSARQLSLDGAADTAAELPVELNAIFWGAPGTSVWLRIARVGASVSLPGTLALPPEPTLPAELDLRAGEVTLLATLSTPEPVEVGVLALARREVRFVRKGIWHVRPWLAEALDPPWRQVLTRGRHGWWDERPAASPAEGESR